ncbi:glycosyltransferase [Pedobacter sp. 22226]|uniref:glycosyltransferase n=1 Tax=Pedobacter sp. 22226 TaxID=3453894 RepID=UPI003F85993E
MKIYRWIDKYNYKVSIKITKRYYTGISKRRTKLYSLSPSFWGDYLLRLLLVFASVIFVKKSAFKGFYNIISRKFSPFFSSDTNPIIYIKTRDLISALFGYRYFVDEATPDLLDRKTILAEKIVFQRSEEPFISVIVTGNYRLDYLYNCLKSLSDHISEKHTFEVILFKNQDHHVNSFLNNNVKGIILLETASFASILENAKGNLIYIQSSEAIIKKNCVELLAEVLKNKEVGCAGAKHLYRNGLLIRTEGDTIFYEDSNHPEFNSQREITHYASANFIFHRDHLSNLNLSDIDLLSSVNIGDQIGQSLAGKNKKVIYQPLAEVVCYNIQQLKAQALIEKPAQKTILFIDDVIPTPDQDSGSNRIFKIMQLVKALGFHVIFLPANGEKKPRYFDQMILEGFEVLYRFPNMRGMIKILEGKLQDIDAVWLCKPHNNEQFKFLFEQKKDLFWIYDTIDLHFLRLQREGDLSGDQSVIQEANDIKQVELNIAKLASITLAITKDEKEILENEGIKNVEIIPNIHEIKTLTEAAGSFSLRSGLLFIGGYLHKPNIDAVQWLVKEIMPLVWAADPRITLTLLGSNPTDEILALRSDRVIVPGYIHDVSAYFHSNRVFVSPLRFGAGMKGKIGQSLEYGLPIVSTDIGVEGIGLTNGHDVMVANDTKDFAEKIIQLYNSPDLWNNIRNNSINVLKAYTPEVIKQQLEELLRNLSNKK